MHGRNLLNGRSFFTNYRCLHPSFCLPTDPWALSIWLRPKKVIAAVKLFFVAFLVEYAYSEGRSKMKPEEE
jgi:hypothetical protein